MKTRFLWADIIRILAIFLVLATHLSYQPEIVTTDGLVYFLYFAVVKTCIPLFVMLSGALLLGKKESSDVFYKKRLGRLLFPWIFWSAIFLFIDKQYFSSIHDILSFFRVFFWTMESFWFLPLIVCLYILTPAIRILAQNGSVRTMAYVVVIWFVVVSLLPYHHNSMAFPRQVDNGLVRQVVNFLGYFISGYMLVSVRSKITPVLSILVFLLGLSWSCIEVFQNVFLQSQQIMYLFDYISPGNVLMSFGIFSFVLSIFANQQAKDGRVEKIVASVSSATLGIYFIHAFVWPYLHQKLHFPISPFPNGTISAIVLFGICFVIIFFLQKIPVLNKFVS